MLAAGRLRHRVTIQQDQGTTRDDNGEHIPDWVTLATVWASVEPLTSREIWAARQTQSDATHKVTVRYSNVLADLSGSVRLIFRGRLFHMTGNVNPDERRVSLVLECTEAQDASNIDSLTLAP